MNVLVALDGSEESFESLKLLPKLPFRERPNVHLLTAYSDAGHHSLPEDFRHALVLQLQSEAHQTLDRATKTLSVYDWQLSKSVEYGHPKTLIIDKAAQHQSDVIVLGAIGHSAAFRVLLGSTADYVANHAKCSVLVARPHQAEHAVSKPLSVVLAYDGSERSNIALKQLASFDWDRKSAKLHVSRVLERPELLPEDMVFDDRMLEIAKREMTDIVDAYPSLQNPTTTVRESTHVGSAIVDEMKAHDGDLLFVGDSGKSALSRFFLGSVSRYLLHHVNESVWIARNKAW